MNIDTKISCLIIIMYASIYSSALIIVFCLLRRLFGLKMHARLRMFIWWLFIALIFSLMFVTNKENHLWNNYLITHFKYGVVPNVDISFFVVGIRNSNNQIAGYTGQVLGQISFIDRDFNTSLLWQGDVTRLLKIVLLVWLSGITVFVLWNLVGYFSLKKYLRNFTICMDGEVKELLCKERGFYGVSSPLIVKMIPHKRYCGSITCPCVVGFSSPVLVLIRDQWQDLSFDEKEAVIAHEIYHIKKKDNYRNLFLVILNGIFWFNPVMWFGLKCMRCDLECLRDIQIINELSKSETKSYANAIISVAKMSRRNYRSSIHSGMLSSSGLGFRVHLLLEHSRWTKFITVVTILIAIILVIFVLIFCIHIPLIQHGIV